MHHQEAFSLGCYPKRIMKWSFLVFAPPPC